MSTERATTSPPGDGPAQVEAAGPLPVPSANGRRGELQATSPRVRRRRRRLSVRSADREALFAAMARIRAFEEHSAALWRRGLISGEMHLGVGEEALFAGLAPHLRDGDGLSVDHRSGPPFVARGVDVERMVLEMLGHEDGLCRGQGGHMHFFEPDRLAASNGIVGAPGPIACGFAMSLRGTGGVAVAVFGDGAANQGMLLESFNLAAAWRLPVVFVCKDNGWAITTRTRKVTGGRLLRRASGFGLRCRRTNGMRAEAVWADAGRAISRARRGRGPSFLLARVRRTEGHFLGDPLIRMVTDPLGEAGRLVPDIAAGLRGQPGAPWRERAAALARLGAPTALIGAEQKLRRRDPLALMRRRLPEEVADELERRARAEVDRSVASALRRAGVRADG